MKIKCTIMRTFVSVSRIYPTPSPAEVKSDDPEGAFVIKIVIAETCCVGVCGRRRNI